MVKCKKCGKEFKSKYANNAHQNIHTRGSEYKCYFCGGTVEICDRDGRLVNRAAGEDDYQSKAVYARCVEEGVWWVMEEFGRLTTREK